MAGVHPARPEGLPVNGGSPPKGATETTARQSAGIVQPPTGEDLHRARMARMADLILWLEEHEHWWAREQRWKREGRS
jgi:hypothetical protein